MAGQERGSREVVSCFDVVRDLTTGGDLLLARRAARDVLGSILVKLRAGDVTKPQAECALSESHRDEVAALLTYQKTALQLLPAARREHSVTVSAQAATALDSKKRFRAYRVVTARKSQPKPARNRAKPPKQKKPRAEPAAQNPSKGTSEAQVTQSERVGAGAEG